MVRNLIQLSNTSKVYFQKVKVLITSLLKDYGENVFYLLISLDLTATNKLLTELLEMMLDNFFK